MSTCAKKACYPFLLGSYGRVYLGKHLDSGRDVVIKMEKQSLETPQLHLEYGFYRELNVHPYRAIPNIYAFGALGSWNYLVMDALGPSLETMFERCEGSFSLVTTIQLAVQLVNLLEAIHYRGILFRDTKPQNFLLGVPNSSKWHVVHIIGELFTTCFLFVTFSRFGFLQEMATRRWLSYSVPGGKRSSRHCTLHEHQ